MKNYFMINKFCQIIDGYNGILIYDLKNKKIFTFNDIYSDIIREFENHVKLDAIKKMYGEKDVIDIINKLLEAEMGSYVDIVNIEEKFRIGKMRKVELENKRSVNRCFIEIPAGCTENCKSCKIPKYMGCETCTLTNKPLKNLDMEFYKNIIERLSTIKIKNYIFHGGDPLTLWSQLEDVIKYTRSKVSEETNILIKSNGVLLNDLMIDKFIKYNISPIIVLNLNDNTANEIKLKLENMDNLLKRLYNANTKFYANVVLDISEKDNINNIFKELSNYNFSSISLTFAINNLSNNTKFKNMYNNNILNDFYNLKQYHPCLNGVLAITADKMIIPCPEMKEDLIGDLSKEDIMNCFEDDIKNIDFYWKMSLDKINSCNNCKYRYSCMDCRAIEKALTNNIHGKRICEFKSS